MKEHRLTIVTPVQTFSQAEDNVVWMYLEFGMAQKYVDDLSRNVKRGLKTKAEMGWFPGPTPPGYLNRTQPDGHKTIAKDPKRFSIGCGVQRHQLNCDNCLNRSIADLDRFFCLPPMSNG